MEREKIVGLLALANIKALEIIELPNRYWPDHPDYAEVRKARPWWLVILPGDMRLVIGWRKRVISIDWEGCPKIRKRMTNDEVYPGCPVTSQITFCHAYGYVKALEYLTTLSKEIDNANAPSTSNAPVVRPT